MTPPSPVTPHEHPVERHAGLAAAHAAVAGGRMRYARVDDRIGACTRAGPMAGTISVRALLQDERLTPVGGRVRACCCRCAVLSADRRSPRGRGDLVDVGPDDPRLATLPHRFDAVPVRDRQMADLRS